jgi:hypothetical protein
MLLLKLVDGVRHHFPGRATEWLFAVIMINWGWILLLPHDTFSLSSSYGVLLTVAPEEVWGIGCLIVGLVRFIALVINGTFADSPYARRSPHVRAVMSALSCFFWMQISLSFLVALGDKPPGTGIAVYPVILWFEVYCAFRAARDAGQVDKAATDAGGR